MPMLTRPFILLEGKGRVNVGTAVRVYSLCPTLNVINTTVYDDSIFESLTSQSGMVQCIRSLALYRQSYVVQVLSHGIAHAVFPKSLTVDSSQATFLPN